MNLDTQSSDSSAEEMRESGRSFQSLIVWGKKLFLQASKANRTLGFLRRNLFSCPHDVKEAAYKSMVRPILEYGSTVWDPHFNGLNDE